jgi:trans-aconitate methyltransferase
METIMAKGKEALYDRLGVNYDATRRADPYIVSRLAHHLLVQPHGQYLDIACATGNYTAALTQADINVHGIDHSPLMIARASHKGIVC